MSDRSGVTIELKAGQREFLDEMVKLHGLDDLGKAVRCLVNYARENPDAQSLIFSEVRCLDC
jgi:hypothetical protein